MLALPRTKPPSTDIDAKPLLYNYQISRAPPDPDRAALAVPLGGSGRYGPLRGATLMEKGGPTEAGPLVLDQTISSSAV